MRAFEALLKQAGPGVTDVCHRRRDLAPSPPPAWPQGRGEGQAGEGKEAGATVFSSKLEVARGWRGVVLVIHDPFLSRRIGPGWDRAFG